MTAKQRQQIDRAAHRFAVAVDHVTVARDNLGVVLRDAQDAGATVRELAELTGWTKSQIHRLIREGAAG